MIFQGRGPPCSPIKYFEKLKYQKHVIFIRLSGLFLILRTKSALISSQKKRPFAIEIKETLKLEVRSAKLHDTSEILKVFIENDII